MSHRPIPRRTRRSSPEEEEEEDVLAELFVNANANANANTMPSTSTPPIISLEVEGDNFFQCSAFFGWAFL
eukprot:CAMPEP_0202032516 /NCGR_PEP_ID=MMETSP0905-20130828/65564_1 /ASSEMBLY_ACC=CAM_ASM_000554 /TAXON_ID=420261 /ORGANISM="Thalassiosira antarctica, Strain CCMP982" /LENGTH=70 /DNA_ID=CAMNT_0048596377 /DNA_START=326 /DNA_END=538 /DNA_ORIENTATION=-